MTIGIIAGSGFDRLEELDVLHETHGTTPWGRASAPVQAGKLHGQPVLFLSRHGAGHALAPHEINYRANVAALRDAGATALLGVYTVGGITAGVLEPGTLVVPHQIVDYTWGREHTVFERDQVEHVDFTHPYCDEMRGMLLEAAAKAGIDALDGGVYAATQGPRLESTAEIARLERDGCDMVGMTGMPEAGLARELGLCYACCAMVVNWAAGKEEGPITMEEITHHLRSSIAQAKRLLAHISL